MKKLFIGLIFLTILVGCSTNIKIKKCTFVLVNGDSLKITRYNPTTKYYYLENGDTISLSRIQKIIIK